MISALRKEKLKVNNGLKRRTLGKLWLHYRLGNHCAVLHSLYVFQFCTFQLQWQHFIVSWSNKVISVTVSAASLIYCLKQQQLPPFRFRRPPAPSLARVPHHRMTLPSLCSSSFCRLETNQSTNPHPSSIWYTNFHLSSTFTFPCLPLYTP